jgi:hypothetical protein
MLRSSRCLIRRFKEEKLRKVLLPMAALVLTAFMFAGHAQHTLADPRDFRFQNGNPSQSVIELYVDTSGPGDYGSNLLSGDSVAPGEGGTIRFNQVDSGKCIYDILAVFNDGSQREFVGIDLCNTASVSVS